MLMYFVNDSWVDITTVLDVGRNVICGKASSFSLFALLQPGQAIQLLHDLVEDVVALNLQQGISNSLDSKLAACLNSLEDLKDNNNDAAVGALGAFINAVQAQSGTQIPEADAVDLISAAEAVVALLVAN